MDKWNGKVAIVTGASSGIGAAIAENLVGNGLQVVGLARRKERLQELAKKLEGKPGKLHPYATDMTVEDDILKAFKWTKENLGPIHILVNNAGVTKFTYLMSGSTADWKSILDTNVLGLSIATREAVEDMRANNVRGHIVHINSVLGHTIAPYPYINHMYTPSKYAVTALSEVLRKELETAGLKIKVTSISPGLVRTEIAQAAKFPDEVRVTGSPTLDSEDVANAVEYVLSTPPHMQVHEFVVTAF